MSNVNEMEQDLRFVSAALHRSRERGVAAIYFLWAGICIVGFTLTDFSPSHAGLYWSVMAPAGFIASCALGIRAQRRRGEVDAADGWREAAHWGATTVVAMVVAGALASDMETVGLIFPMLLLVLALGYFLAGVHMDRRLTWLGLLLFVGALVFQWFAIPMRWTVFGVLFSAALVISGVLAGKQRTSDDG